MDVVLSRHLFSGLRQLHARCTTGRRINLCLDINLPLLHLLRFLMERYA